MIVHATIKAPEKLKEYAAVGNASSKAAGGEVVLAGSHDHPCAAIIRFANSKAARDWYVSDAYKSAVFTREQAMDAVFILAEDPPD